MSLVFNRLWDYSYSSAHHVYEVKQGDTVLGVLENWEGLTEWQAFSGSGFSCKFLSRHYSKRAAVEAIERAACKLMNFKFFGVAALIGLAYFWLLEHDAQAAPNGIRTLSASWYGERERGRVTASGDIFDPDRLTAASWEFYKKKIRVTGPKGSVIVFCNDRGPHKRLLKTRQIDLSRAAFSALAPLKLGLIQVRVEVL